MPVSVVCDARTAYRRPCSPCLRGRRIFGHSLPSANLCAGKDRICARSIACMHEQSSDSDQKNARGWHLPQPIRAPSTLFHGLGAGSTAHRCPMRKIVGDTRRFWCIARCGWLFLTAGRRALHGDDVVLAKDTWISRELDERGSQTKRCSPRKRRIRHNARNTVAAAHRRLYTLAHSRRFAGCGGSEPLLAS